MSFLSLIIFALKFILSYMNSCTPILFFLFFPDCSFFFLTWGVLPLQYCVCFCYTMKWISYMHTYIASLSDPLPTPSVVSIWVTTEHQAEIYSKFALHIYFIHGSAHRSIWFTNSSHPPPPPHVWLLCLHFHSCPAHRFSCIIFQDSIYMHKYIIIVFLMI